MTDINKLGRVDFDELHKAHLVEFARRSTRDESPDSQVIYEALGMWRNYIQTGNVALSTDDLRNMEREREIRKLQPEQQAFVTRLESMMAKQLLAYKESQ